MMNSKDLFTLMFIASSTRSIATLLNPVTFKSHLSLLINKLNNFLKDSTFS